VSRSCACIGSLCLRRCRHGASVGGGGGGGGGGEAGILGGLKAARYLTALDLSGNTLERSLREWLPSKLPSLQTLLLDRNRLASVGPVAALLPALKVPEHNACECRVISVDRDHGLMNT
jgi:hypothetical protein